MYKKCIRIPFIAGISADELFAVEMVGLFSVSISLEKNRFQNM